MVLDNPVLYNQSILNGNRWSKSVNQPYIMPADVFNNAFKNGSIEEIAQIVRKFVERHSSIDAPRIVKLQRYYLGDNDIHYWHNDKKAKGRSDNRIASGFAKFITNMRVGYMLGKPIQFKYNSDDEDENVKEDLDSFNKDNDEEYHEKVMKTNLSTTGRAYELLYAGESAKDADGNYLTPDVKMRAIDPATAFVVYDTTIDQHSLFGVRYYMVDYDNNQTYYVDVYTANMTYHLKTTDLSVNGNYSLLSKESTSFGAVPLTEFINNENKTGDWESKLDEIDAYDLAMSEMANSEGDFANAKLFLSGDIDFSDDKVPLKKADGSNFLDDDGNPVMVPKVDTKDPYLMAKPSVIPNPSGSPTVIESKAEYLTKQLNEQGWQTYINQLITDIHKDTNTPNTTDEAFSGQSSGVALMYKLFGEDQERSMQESLYTRGIMRRLRLLGNFWKHNREINDSSIMSNYKPHYTPNLPKNNVELVDMIVKIWDMGLISKETCLEMLSQITGKSAQAEMKRIKKQQQKEEPGGFDDAPLRGVNQADLEAAKQQAKKNIGPTTKPELISKLRNLSGSNE
ncbi:phage portal protein [Limosilactobacillus balticus]|uniref:Phage portal protein n=1 Tax=Limosilactobacillus balticus TaxID=2759747 RepID=A0ABS8RCN0_9LACO|nr:phage portal protein [Limosilactobacillus balticus]MCD7138786.1 phage portal protein [Limosilactobacillus balticus]